MWILVLAGGLAAGACGGGGGDDGSSTTDGGDVDAPPPPIDAAIDAPPLAHFSFFATSLKALRELSGSQNGFGGDLRFGETGPGAGLRGADKICAAIAEMSMPGSSVKQWRAFLSAANDGNGNVVNAIDRIGNGPWYDRLGRLFAQDKAGAMGNRPQGDAAIRNDFPNEDGVPNHNPDGTGQVDNHDFLTGTNAQGRLQAANRTCLDWTGGTGNKATEGQPQVGHSWPRMGESWMAALVESGCAPGVNLIETGPPNPNSNTVGSGGGYGGFYCFALTP
ncbi:MAG TPA: hypothetical protein VHE35_26075 [Kofleriaceae bacterium]|nr:hypothetical protein [Kofleriaceae bacterium]